MIATLLLCLLPAQEEVTVATTAAIDKSLRFLASRQSSRGNLPGSVPIASTSMACLAWMAQGSTPHSGSYSVNIRRALAYLRRCCSREGFIAGDAASGMYGHGFATLALGEASGMLRDPSEVEETRDVLARAVRLLERAQNRFGGWNASPDGSATDDGSGAVAIMQIMALRAARNAGIQVRMETVHRARKYVEEMTSSDGWFAYNYNMRGGGGMNASSARTGAGMYMFGAMDLISDPRYVKGIANLMKTAPFLGGSSTNDFGWSGWWPFTAFYSSLAVYQHGGEEWRKWYPAIRDHLIKTQSSDGSWSTDSYGGLFVAFSVLVLELPYRFLPLFQEGGRAAEGGGWKKGK